MPVVLVEATAAFPVDLLISRSQVRVLPGAPGPTLRTGLSFRPRGHLLLPGVHAGRCRRAGYAGHPGRRRVHLADLSVLLFAVPSAMILSELGATYTEEGGPYVWVRLAFGHLAGAINNFFYWVTNPVWMGGTLVGTAIGGLVVFFNDGKSSATRYVFAAVFIWPGVLFAILSFKVGKWVATVGAIARFLLLGFFIIVVVVYGARAWLPRPVLRVLHADVLQLRPAGAADPVQPGRFRTAQRRRRGDGGPRQRRSGRHRQVGHRDRVCSTACRCWASWWCCPGPVDRPGRLPGRGQAGADRLRRHCHDRRRRHRDLHPHRVEHRHRLGAWGSWSRSSPSPRA